MTEKLLLPCVEGSESTTLASALAQSKVVEDRVQACAADLGVANTRVKRTIADGATQLAADLVLKKGERVEAQVQECAADLNGVNATLALGVSNLKAIETALARSRHDLARTELALHAARAEEQSARHDALHDTLTGLPNRAHFDSRLEQAIASAKRHALTVAVMFFDLDGFKQINDVHGHAAGDAVLQEVANRLMGQLREEDAVCRNGGDEFLCFLMNPKGPANVQRIVEGILAKVSEPIHQGGLDLAVEVSIGIAVYPANGTTGDDLIRSADAAMYAAKRDADSGWMLSEIAGLDD